MGKDEEHDVAVFMVVSPCSLALMMVAASTFETLLNFYQTTQHCNPEDGHLCTCNCESLKFVMNCLTSLYSHSHVHYYTFFTKLGEVDERVQLILISSEIPM